MNYRKAVERGKALVSALNQNQWELGDLALEVAPMGGTHANNGSTEKLARFADEIGIEFDTLQKYRQVADAWPLRTRVLSASWSVHRELMGEKDVLRRLAVENKGVRITVNMARLASGRAPANYPKPEPRRINTGTSRPTSADTWEPEYDEDGTPDVTDSPAWQDSHATLQATEVGHLLAKAGAAIDDAIALLRQPGVADKATWFEPSYDRLVLLVEAVGSYVKGGSVSQAAEEILRGTR